MGVNLEQSQRKTDGPRQISRRKWLQEALGAGLFVGGGVIGTGAFVLAYLDGITWGTRLDEIRKKVIHPQIVAQVNLQGAQQIVTDDEEFTRGQVARDGGSEISINAAKKLGVALIAGAFAFLGRVIQVESQRSQRIDQQE